MTDTHITPDFKATPFWWEEAKPQPANEPVPEETDVVIVGSGYCGLMAAITLARGGMRTVVLEAGDPGMGASSRNHGHIGPYGGKIPANLAKRVGEAKAEEIWQASREAGSSFFKFLKEENLDVDYIECGRFIGAHSTAAYDALSRNLDSMRRNLNVNARMVTRSHQQEELGSDYYHGGIVYENGGALHPGKLHQEILRLAKLEGVTICGNTRVEEINGSGPFVVKSVRGKIKAKEVVVATNAYTDSLLPWLRRRIIPITAYMVATEQMSESLSNQVMPTNRTGGDTKRALYAFRKSPCGRRLIFAGRAKFGDTSERDAAKILRGFYTDVWPQMKDIKVSYSWKGYVGFTFDFMTHTGMHNGYHYVAGCQGSGVVLMSYLGTQIAKKILGQRNRSSAFELQSFPTVPLYSGKPWFIPAVGSYYNFRDKLDRKMSH